MNKSGSKDVGVTVTSVAGPTGCAGGAALAALLSLGAVGCSPGYDRGDDFTDSLVYGAGNPNGPTPSGATGSGPTGAVPPLPSYPPASYAPAGPSGPSSYGTPATDRTATLIPLSVSFAGGSGAKIHRTCSDNAAKRARASLYEATGLAVVPVSTPSGSISPLVTDGRNATNLTLKMLKDMASSSGTLTFPVDARYVGTTPTLYAIVATGTGFGSPMGSGMNIAPPVDGDAERFPDNSGVVGYFDAHYDPSTGKVVATARSELLYAANPKVVKRDSSEWDGPADGCGCDDYDSPLVLDLSPSGRGVVLSTPTSDLFDIDGDGTRDRLSWIASPDTPLLAFDANENGVVDGIDELFGNATRGRFGARSSENGFAALAAHDANGDGVIDGSDPVWRHLRLWFDRDHDGRTGPGELEPLDRRRLGAISLAYASVNEGLVAAGEVRGAIRQRGAAYTADGRAVPLVDVWFWR